MWSTPRVSTLITDNRSDSDRTWVHQTQFVSGLGNEVLAHKCNTNCCYYHHAIYSGVLILPVLLLHMLIFTEWGK